jgi:multiple sugar transport system permease protein
MYKRKYIQVIGAWLVALSMFFPVYWMAISSLKSDVELMSRDLSYVPTAPTLVNFDAVLRSTDFMVFFTNSIIAATGCIIITVVVSALGGYGLARAKMRGKIVIARVLLISYMLSPLMLAIPLYLIGRHLGILNTYFGLILSHLSMALPFAIWIMWKFFQAIPLSYEEAAWTDGASPLRALLDIVLPIAAPGMAAVAVFAFAVSWGDFTMAAILMPDSNMWTVSVGMMTFIDQHSVHWGMIMAGAVLVATPPVLLVYFLQRYLILGLRVGDGA